MGFSIILIPTLLPFPVIHSIYLCVASVYSAIFVFCIRVRVTQSRKLKAISIQITALNLPFIRFKLNNVIYAHRAHQTYIRKLFNHFFNTFEIPKYIEIVSVSYVCTFAFFCCSCSMLLYCTLFHFIICCP